MEKLKQLLANFHQSPVKTVLGTLAAVSSWLALRPEVNAPFSWQNLGAMALAGVFVVWGGVSTDGAPKAPPAP